MHIATNKSWKNYQIDNPKQIDIDLHFTNKQFLKLTQGLVPQEMEDKWFIYFENDWLYFHRSWTGSAIYKAQLHKENNGYYINEFWAERNRDKHNNDDDNADIETFSFLIAKGLLGIDVSSKLHTEDNILKKWSDFGNMVF